MGKSEVLIQLIKQKLDIDDLMYYRDRFDVPLTDAQVKNIEYYKPDQNSPEIKYIKERRLRLGGFILKIRFC